MLGRRRGLRRRAVVGGFAVAFALGVASASWACQVLGFTWYADGTYMKSGPSGVVVQVYATGARTGRAFQLVSSRSDGMSLPCQGDPQLVNPNPRWSNARGLIPMTAGVLNRPVGEWMICFVEPGPNPFVASYTAPVYFTVL